MGAILDSFVNLWHDTGIANFNYQNGIMIIVSFIFLYLAIRRGFEPLLLVPIAFGMLLSNLPVSGIFIEHFELTSSNQLSDAGVLTVFYLMKPILPSLIFLGVGSMTDFGPLIANPKSLIMGAAAQFGIFFAFFAAIALGFNAQEAASIGIIGGADGPTAIYLTSKLADHLFRTYRSSCLLLYGSGSCNPAADHEGADYGTRKTDQDGTAESRISEEKILFPIAVTTVVVLLLPSAAPLVGMLMLGNLFKECGRTGRLADTAGNALMNILVILLGTCVGASATGQTFITASTLKIVVLGVCAFAVGTAGGVLIAKLMNVLTGGKINPLIGSAGVSAVPMAARVSQIEGQKANPSNFLLMHAMGPNVAGVIGSAVAASVMLSMFGGY